MFREKIKILAVFGTRPEIIKMAPVIKEFKKYDGKFSCKICSTAQHRQMVDSLLKLFQIAPDYDLNIMEKNQTLEHITRTVLKSIDEIILMEKPDFILVQGDTTTAMVAGLAAFYRKTKVGHIEAGLRTWDKAHPYPEEVNRKIIDSLSDLFFAHTKSAKENLLKEGIPKEKVEITGNTVIDCLLQTSKMEFKFSDPLLIKIINNNKKIILVTAHRRESFGETLFNICNAIKKIAIKYHDKINIVYPVHLNPNVKDTVEKNLNNLKNVFLIEPMEYLPFVHLMKNSYFILTDSGGIQEEAPSLGKPVLVMRKVTERPEAVAMGVVKITGVDSNNIIKDASELLDNELQYKKMSKNINPYGDGNASQRIVNRIIKEYE